MDTLESITANIAAAAQRAGRNPDDVTLIAVSKTRSAEEIRPLLEAGHRDFGENRVQEAQDKWLALREDYPDVRLHMVGQLQSNKAADAIAQFDAIHSLDRASLLKAIAKAGDSDLPDLFVQVDLGGESQKGGVAPADLEAFLDDVAARGMAVAGLMCIPPVNLEASPFFALLAELARRHEVNGLSMGMSADYEEAVMLGATHVRVGSALFGPRA